MKYVMETIGGEWCGKVGHCLFGVGPGGGVVGQTKRAEWERCRVWNLLFGCSCELLVFESKRAKVRFIIFKVRIAPFPL